MAKKIINNKTSGQAVRKTNTIAKQTKTNNNGGNKKIVPRNKKINKTKRKIKPAKNNTIFGFLVRKKRNDFIKSHPKFPFWARLKISKNRTTLVIDEEKSLNKKSNKIEDQFVHREATTPTDDEKRNKKYERVSPNPDKTKKDDMLLKHPTKLPKGLFKPHDRKLTMPKELKEKYDKNNNKDKKE